MTGVRSPLQSPRLRRILAAYTINRLGNWFGLIAIALAVFDHTHSALAVAALLFAGQALPAFAVPALVARVEASARGSELSGLYFFEALTMGALAAILLWHFSLPAVLLLAVLDGTAGLAASALLRTELARAARESVAAPPGDAEPEHESHSDEVEEAERKANAALNIAFSATFVLGPVLAGVVVAVTGSPAALLIDVGSFLACGSLVIGLHPHVEEAGGDSVGARLRAAWRHINEAPSLRGLLLAEAFAFVFFESAGPIEVSYVKGTLHAGDRGYGFLLSAWGAGSVLGSIVFARSLRRPLGVLLSTGTLVVGLAYVGISAAPSLLLACSIAFVGGVGNGVELPSLFSAVQRLTPSQLHGRLMGAIESLSAVCVAIGLPLGGTLVAISSPRTAFLVVGLGATASGGALFRLTRSKPVTKDDDAPTRHTKRDGLPQTAAQKPIP